MTQPVAHGYPDWGRVQAGADKLLIDEAFNVTVSPTTRGPYFVGDVPYIGVDMSPVGLTARVTYQFYLDSALTIPLGAYQFDLQDTQRLLHMFATQGPFLAVTVEGTALPGTFNNKIWTTHSPFGFNRSSTSNVLITTTANAVGAGATVILGSNFVLPGPAVWNVFTALATFTAFLESQSFTGVLTRLDTINQAQGNAYRSVYLPGQSARINFTNGTGAAGTFNATLMVQPYWPGS